MNIIVALITYLISNNSAVASIVPQVYAQPVPQALQKKLYRCPEKITTMGIYLRRVKQSVGDATKLEIYSKHKCMPNSKSDYACYYLLD